VANDHPLEAFGPAAGAVLGGGPDLNIAARLASKLAFWASKMTLSLAQASSQSLEIMILFNAASTLVPSIIIVSGRYNSPVKIVTIRRNHPR
jgi:hypothetical protein